MHEIRHFYTDDLSYMFVGIHINDIVQDYSNSILKALKLPQSCAKPSIWSSWTKAKYRQVSNIRRTLVVNWIVGHSDVVGVPPVGAAPTTFSFST